MATPAQIQAQLDPAGTGNVINILQSWRVDATYDEHYVEAINGGATAGMGKQRWVRTTSANTAAQQATSIINGLV